MAVVIDFIAETVGKLPTGLKLTAESIFLVLKKYISLLAQGTKSIIEFINNIFAAILKWILVVTGKIARQAFLLVLASGKRLACSIIPLEDIVILFSRIISARVKSNLAKLGVTVLESDGRYFVRYGEEIIFVGDNEIIQNFINQTLDKEEANAKKYLDELALLSRKKVQLKYKGKVVDLERFRWVRMEYVKRVKIEVLKLRNAFDNGIRKKFLQEAIYKNPEVIRRLKQAGMTDVDITKIAEGFVPNGWSVHHRYPLDDSGSNKFSNFILIKNDPNHYALTGYQKPISIRLQPNQSELLDWPIFDDIIYP